MKLFLLSISFFTRLPIPKLKNVSTNDMYRSMLLIPFVGLVIGLILFGITHLLKYINLDVSVLSLIVTFFYIYITGAIHYDGVADTVDALYSNKDQSEILRVMKDVNVGTFGTVSLTLFILSIYVLINYLIKNNFLTLILIFPIIGRFSAIQIGAFFKSNNNNHGLGYNFCKQDNFFIFLGYTLIILVLLFFLRNFNCILSFFIIIISNYILGFIIVRKTNGVTGDILGLIIELSQLEFLLCFIILENILG